MSRLTATIRYLLLASFASLVFCGGSAQAEDKLKLSGFGSVGIVHENLDFAGFTRNTTQPIDESSNTSRVTDSMLGLQANLALTPQLEAVAQFVVRDQKDPTLNHSFEWAYAAWRPTENAELRLGRVGVDSFMLSDYRNVGFAQTWARPPTEFYGWIPLYSVNGADATYHFDTGNTHWHLKAQYGSDTSRIPFSSDNIYKFKADDITVLNLRADHGPWQFMGAYTSLTIGSEAILSQLSNSLAQFATAAPFPAMRSEARQLNNSLWSKGSKVHYLTFGAAYQDGTWQFQSEIAKISADSPVLMTGTTAYAMLGRRFGSVTPYVIASAFRPEHSATTAQTNWGALGAQYATLQAAAIGAANTYRIDQKGLALGARWDITSNVAFKLQWDRKWIGANGYGLWQIDNTAQGFQAKRADIVSAVVDFTF